MKAIAPLRSFILQACFPLLLLGLPLHALDNASSGFAQGLADGLDDIWQSKYNAWGLSGAADADSDGCSNLLESIAGTDPFKAGDCLKVGNTIVTATSVTFYFDSEGGKRYRVLSNGQPTGTFSTVENITHINGTVQGAGVSSYIPAADSPAGTPHFVRINKSGGTMRFYKLEVADADSDADGLSDWNERQMGTDPVLAASPTNASGGQGNDLQVMNDLLSLTATVTTANGFERMDKSASTVVAAPAVVSLSRTVSRTYPLTVPLAMLNGTSDPTKSNASAGDYTAPATVTIPANTSSVAVNVTPVQDASDEVPEYARLQFSLPGLPNATKPEGTVCICDANPTVPENNQLYVAYLGHEAGMTTTASGYATALVNGDNTSASIALVFNNLSSDQNTAYIRNVSGGVPSNDLAPALPLGQISGFSYNVVYKPGFYSTDQAFLAALGSGGIGCAITSAKFPEKEIWGVFSKTSGSTTFNEGSPVLAAPAAGVATWATSTNEQIERDIWRFMSQSTWGGTTAMYEQIRGKVDNRINTLGANPTQAQITNAYLQGLDDWLTEQMNPAVTPTINFQTLVMAADNEDLMLRGNKQSTYNSDPQINGARYTVTFDAAGNPTFGTTADTITINTNYPISGPNRRREWWGMVLQSKDQVRQRLTQALSEIVIISEADQTCADRHYGTANYWDMLAANAFGKYRLLLEKVTYNPMMGIYLSAMANRATYDAGGGLFVSPDENYAREIMQLFSIGLIRRHPDGSLVLDATGLPIPTYDQTDITELARVMTGFSHGARHATSYYSAWNGTSLTFNPSTSTRTSSLVLLNGSSATNTWFGRDDGHLFWPAPWVYPMEVIGRIGTTVYHDFGQKTLLAGKAGETIIPAQTITTMTDAQTHLAADTDLRLAHNCLAGDPTSDTAYNGHPNTPVNLSRWLIQRLVTSNPSAGYIYRVQKRYRDTNGNLGEVLKAILLDYEARSLQLADTSISHGKVKEPILAFSAMLRAFRAFSGAPMSILAQDTGMTAGDSPLPNGYPASEIAKFSSDNLSPPSLPAGWPTGPFRYRFNDLTGAIGQSPQRAPSVFNWFLPDYVLPGQMAEAGLFAPELQINTEASVVAKVNTHYAFTWSTLTGMSTQPGSDSNITDFLLNNNFATPAVRFSLDGGISFTNSLTFTPANGTTPQTVTVVAANTPMRLSSLDDTTLRFTVAGTGSGFDAIPALPLTINFSDDEIPNEGILALQTSFSTWVQENGNMDTVNVRLQAPPPTGASITVNITTTAANEVTVSPASLSFDSTNWNTDQVVTVTAVVDDISEASGTGNDTLTFTSASSIGAWSGRTATLPVNVIENNTTTPSDPNASFGIIISETGGGTTVNETAGSDTYSVRLSEPPTANVTLTITGNTGIYIGATGTSTTGTLTFTSTNYATAQTVTVRANNDSTAEGSYPANPAHYSTITHTASGGGYNGVQAQTIIVPITDDDNRVIMSHTGGETRIMEGSGSDTITVALRIAPTTNVVVNLGSNSVICEPANLTFTPANFSTPQNVTVRAVDDAFSQGIRRAWYPNILPATASATATQSAGVVTGVNITNAGAGYLTPPNVTFSAPSSGTTATGFCTLNATGGIAGIAIANPGSGYTANPTISLSVVPPNVTTSKIIASATSEGISDTGYNNVWAATHTGLDVTIIDNDNAGVSVTQSSGTTLPVEGGTTDDFIVSLTQQPLSDVTITLSPSTQVTCSQNVLTFTPANWANGQTVVVTAVNDTTVEGDALTSIGILVDSADPAYKGVQARPLGLTVIDNDLVPLTISHTSVFTGVTEGGTAGTGGTPNVSDTFTVSLPKTPTANVTVTLIPDGQISVSPTTLAFSTTNSSTAQTITVTAIDDETAEATPHNGMIRFAVSSADPFYNNPAHLPIFVPVRDNDGPGLSIIESSGNTIPTEGSTDSYTLVLTRQPPAGQNVVFDLACSSPTDQLISVTGTLNGCATTNGSVNVTTLTTVGLAVGTAISGTGIPTGSTVASITNGTTFTLSAAATATNTGQTFNTTTANLGAASVTFNNTNWATTQTVTLTAIADMVAEGREVATITHTINAASATRDTSYDGLAVQTVNSFITEQHRRNESIILIPSGGSIGSNETVPTGGNTFVTEGDPATDSVDIYLSNAPQIPVVITLTANAQMGFDKNTLTFTPSDWNVPQTVQISAIDDLLNDTYAIINGTLTQAAQSQTLTATAASGDPAFFGLTATTSVNILDNESPAVKITQSGGITTTTESSAGGTNIDTYTAVLTTPPNGNVVVRVTSASTTAGQTVTPAVLTFTPANWSTPQTVTVTAFNDTSVEGNHRSNITHAIRAAVVLPITGCSTTASATTVTAGSVTGLFAGMVVTGPGIPLNATITSINTTTNSFVLNFAATATATGQSLMAYGTTPDSTGAVLLLSNGATISGNNSITCASTTNLQTGMLLYGNGIPAGTTIVSVTNSTTFVASAPPTAAATGLTLAAIAATTDSSGYSEILSNATTTSGSTTVTCDSTAGLAAGMSIWGPGIPASATISSISTTNSTTLTLSTAATTTASALSLYTSITGLQTVVNNITDDDNRIIIGVTGLDTRVHEDGTLPDTYNVVLRSQPTANVTITPSVTGGFASQGLSISPSTMTFTAGTGGNWATPQTFTLSGIDNSLNAERARTVTISHASNSSDTNFNSQSIHQVAVSALAKDDRRVLLIDNPSGHENGNTGTYRFALNRAPSTDVTISLTADAQVQVAPPVPAGGILAYSSTASLTFTPSNWNVFQTVTLRPSDDTLFEPLYNTGSGFIHTGIVSHALSGDASFTGLPAGNALMSISDNEVPAVRILPSNGTTQLREGGQTDSYDVVLNMAPSASVTIGINPDSQVIADKTSLTFTSGNWSTPQTVVLTAVNDTTADGNHTGIVTHTNATSADPNFTFLPVPALSVDITDNDGAQLVVTQTGGSTSVVEGGSVDTITIALNQAPLAGVTVTLVPPMYIVPVPPHAKRWGYYTTDLSGSNQNRERVVVDYTEWILLYRNTFYASLATAYGSSANIPVQPSDVSIQNAHWSATKALVDKGDLWFTGGSLKARFPVLIEPNQPRPSPTPPLNPRQALMDAIYNLNGGNINASTIRYLPEIIYVPNNPPSGSFHDEIRDRIRWTGYLMSTVMNGFVSH